MAMRACFGVAIKKESEMSERAVRVTLVQIDDDNETIDIDLVLSGDRAKPGQDYFGIYTDKSDNSRCPFVLGRDGRIDYGSGFAEDDQYYNTNLLQQAFAVGASITCSYEGEDFDYKITKVTPLAA